MYKKISNVALTLFLSSSSWALAIDTGAIKTCQAQYDKFTQRIKQDRPAVTQKFVAALQQNKKTHNMVHLRAQIRQITSEFLQQEFKLMSDKETLSACLKAAKSHHVASYLPVMVSYLSNKNLPQAVKWCHQAVAAKVTNTQGQVVEQSLCDHLKTMEQMLQA